MREHAMDLLGILVVGAATIFVLGKIVAVPADASMAGVLPVEMPVAARVKPKRVALFESVCFTVLTAEAVTRQVKRCADLHGVAADDSHQQITCYEGPERYEGDVLFRYDVEDAIGDEGQAGGSP